MWKKTFKTFRQLLYFVRHPVYQIINMVYFILGLKTFQKKHIKHIKLENDEPMTVSVFNYY